MKTQTILASLVVAASSFAQNGPAPSPTPQTFTIPVIPPGTNTAAVAAPKLDWIQRVEENVTRARKQADKVQIVFDGDSITEGWRNPGVQVWGERYLKFNAFDFAIGGDRIQNLLWRLNQGQVDGIRPKLIALMIGTNSINSNTVEEIAEGVKSVVSEYQKRCPEAVILLQAIFPRAEKADNPLRVKVKAVNEIISKLSDGKKVIYIDFGEKFLDAEGNIPKEIMGDFLHPSRKGYQIWADAIQPIIDQYVPAQPAK